MNLESTLLELAKDEGLKRNKTDIELAIVFSHNKENGVGIFPYSDDGTPIRVIEYLLQGFLKECEILTMVQSLLEVKAQVPELYDEIIKTMSDMNYQYTSEVLDRIDEEEGFVNDNSTLDGFCS